MQGKASKSKTKKTAALDASMLLWGEMAWDFVLLLVEIGWLLFFFFSPLFFWITMPLPLRFWGF